MLQYQTPYLFPPWVLLVQNYKQTLNQIIQYCIAACLEIGPDISHLESYKQDGNNKLKFNFENASHSRTESPTKLKVGTYIGK